MAPETDVRTKTAPRVRDVFKASLERAAADAANTENPADLQPGTVAFQDGAPPNAVAFQDAGTVALTDN